ncbi:hypothetical protein CIHG_06225 [Coccidioides immitis H538.4]|uniref:Fungal-type protein kinase domain-containing protein n=1 Tax=Coccidioides immitis H538.4 TaxID=396776 RepID=A0A0J8RT77_COCIT|nr:hypothetical protein CIHG_06225 [Coccidioides immitis H538.4]
MAELSPAEESIIKEHPLAGSLSNLCSLLQEAETIYESHQTSSDTAINSLDQLYQNALSKLLHALLGGDAAFNLRSRIADQNVDSDLADLFKRSRQGHLRYDHCQPLVRLVIQNAADTDIWKAVYDLIATVTRAERSTPPPRSYLSILQTPRSRNTGSLANSSELRRDIDAVLREELLGDLHADIPGFYAAYFDDIEGLVSTAQAVFENCKAGDSPLYCEESGWKDWPDNSDEKPVLEWLTEVIDRLVQFAEDHNPSRTVVRRPLAQPARPIAGSAAKRKLDIGFVDDPHTTPGKRYHWSQILVPGELKNDRQYDIPSGARLDLARYAREDGLQFITVILGFLFMNRQQLGFDPTIVTVDDRHCIEIERDGKKERLIIDAVILRACCVAGRATTWKAHRQGDERTLVVKDSWQYQSAMRRGNCCAKQWRVESRMLLNITFTKLSSWTARTTINPPNRVHRRVIVRDYGKPIYESSSRVALLVGMEGCIVGYESLYTKAGLIQSDISPRNLLVNEDDNNPSWRSFLIDLDLAIRAQRDGFSGARGKTGTRAFMAIGVLYGEKHSFMHDLESFFWVLFWICIHYEGPGRARHVEDFEQWNYMNTRDLAGAKKGVISDESDFLTTMDDYFTPYYQPLSRWVNRLRRVVFPNGGRWKEINPNLGSEMRKILQDAQEDMEATD